MSTILLEITINPRRGKMLIEKNSLSTQWLGRRIERYNAQAVKWTTPPQFLPAQKEIPRFLYAFKCGNLVQKEEFGNWWRFEVAGSNNYLDKWSETKVDIERIYVNLHTDRDNTAICLCHIKRRRRERCRWCASKSNGDFLKSHWRTRGNTHCIFSRPSSDYSGVVSSD